MLGREVPRKGSAGKGDVLVDDLVERACFDLSGLRELPYAMTKPVVTTGGQVAKGRTQVRVTGHRVEPRPFREPLRVPQVSASRPPAVGDLAVGHGHEHVVLHISVVLRVEGAQEQPIGPGPLDEAHLDSATDRAVAVVKPVDTSGR
jgi:hypothetical protein